MSDQDFESNILRDSLFQGSSNKYLDEMKRRVVTDWKLRERLSPLITKTCHQIKCFPSFKCEPILSRKLPSRATQNDRDSLDIEYKTCLKREQNKQWELHENLFPLCSKLDKVYGTHEMCPGILKNENVQVDPRYHEVETVSISTPEIQNEEETPPEVFESQGESQGEYNQRKAERPPREGTEQSLADQLNDVLEEQVGNQSAGQPEPFISHEQPRNKHAPKYLTTFFFVLVAASLLGFGIFLLTQEKYKVKYQTPAIVLVALGGTGLLFMGVLVWQGRGSTNTNAIEERDSDAFLF